MIVVITSAHECAVARRRFSNLSKQVLEVRGTYARECATFPGKTEDRWTVFLIFLLCQFKNYLYCTVGLFMKYGHVNLERTRILTKYYIPHRSELRPWQQKLCIKLRRDRQFVLFCFRKTERRAAQILRLVEEFQVRCSRRSGGRRGGSCEYGRHSRCYRRIRGLTQASRCYGHVRMNEKCCFASRQR